MTTVATASSGGEERVASLALGSWRISTRQVAAVACVGAFAVALWQVPAGSAVAARAWCVLLFVEVMALSLPWGMPRDRRGGLSFWIEALLGLTAPVGALVVAVLTGATWLTSGAHWSWFAVAAGFGGGLVLLSGMDPRSILRGELAFLMGPTPAPHAAARALTGAASPYGEEVLFRGVVLAVPSTVAFPVGLLAAVAFVARHHISAGHWRGSVRSMAVEIVAACGLLTLTVLSHSIYPALLAHMINNLPMSVLHIQRGITGRRNS